MDFHLETLEFNKILSQITKYSKSFSAKVRIESIHPLAHIELIIDSQNIILECMEVLVKSGDLNLIQDYDIIDILNLIKHKRLLTIKDIQYLRLFLVMSQQIKTRSLNFLKENITINALQPYFEHITTFRDLLVEIDSIIDPDGVVLDNASDTLYKLRKEKRRLEEKRKNILNGLLQKKASILNESLLVLRNDRYCLPVKTEFKNQIKGIIHDVSSSGTTTYIEPQDAYELTTSLLNLGFQEQEEIEKIIYILLEEIYPSYDALLLNLETFIELDVYFSIAHYSLHHNMVKPQIGDDVFIKGARHPLIKEEDVVAIDIKLSALKPILMITGPNTGGKTVALKTLGLLSIMNQSGLLIPAKEAKMRLFSGIYADIGDKQSIVQSLSTFSSHILNIKQILDNAKKESLLLFDELGSGTDPKEGVSLAKAITDYAIEQNIFLVLTTHYSELKVFAYENPLIENASVRFNDETLEPLYTIDYGRSGASNALKIAKRLGMNQVILDKAHSYIEDTKSDVSKIILAFEEKQRHLDELIEKTDKLQTELTTKSKTLDGALKKLELEKVLILEDAKKQSQQLLKQQQEKFHEALEQLKTIKQAHEVAKLKHEVSKLGIKIEEHSDEDFQIGDQVYIKSYAQNGEIIDIKKEDFIVKFGHFELAFKQTDLLKQSIKKVKTTKRREKETFIMKQASSELDLRGYRAIDVKDAYLKFIDDALLSNLKELKVIHGYGTGAVKKALYDEIKKDENISSYRFGGEYEGASGVTILTLK